MLSRRKFAACALCAVTGFAATAVGDANAQMPAGLKRTILSKTEMPDGKYVALLVAVEIDAGVTVPRHTHPGVEFRLLHGRQRSAFHQRPARSYRQSRRGLSGADRGAARRQSRRQAGEARHHLHGGKGQAACHAGAGMIPQPIKDYPWRHCSFAQGRGAISNDIREGTHGYPT